MLLLKENVPRLIDYFISINISFKKNIEKNVSSLKKRLNTNYCQVQG